jgi:hypothetical protein
VKELYDCLYFDIMKILESRVEELLKGFKDLRSDD